MTSRTLAWFGYWFLAFLVSLVGVGILVVTGSPGALFNSVYVLPASLLAMLFLFLVPVVGQMPGLDALSYYRSALAGECPTDGSAPPPRIRTAVELVFSALVTYAVMGTLLFSPARGRPWGVPGLPPTPDNPEPWFALAVACLFLCSLLWPILWITR